MDEEMMRVMGFSSFGGGGGSGAKSKVTNHVVVSSSSKDSKGPGGLYRSRQPKEEEDREEEEDNAVRDGDEDEDEDSEDKQQHNDGTTPFSAAEKDFQSHIHEQRKLQQQARAMLKQAQQSRGSAATTTTTTTTTTITTGTTQTTRTPNALLQLNYQDSDEDEDEADDDDDEKETSTNKTNVSKKEEEEEEVEIGPPIPVEFQNNNDNKSTTNNDENDEDEDEDEDVGPPLPPNYYSTQNNKDNDNDSNDEDDDDDDDDDSQEEEEEEEEEEDELLQRINRMPVSHEITLHHGKKPVTAVGLDPSGSRLITGGHDYLVSFWDFAGMDRSLKSFRTIEPFGRNPIRSIQYNNNGENFVVVSTSPQLKVYTREGSQIVETVKGDMYLSDMGNTKGHTSSITGVAWHPKDKNVFVSSSLDATIRVWDLTVNLGMTTITKQKDLIRVKNAQGRKATISCVSFSPDGNWIIGGIEDGSIQLWKSSGPFLRPNTTIKSAHETREGSCITSIKMSRDGSKLLSRAMDNTLKLWNAKSPSKPAVFVWSDLLTLHEETECGFSPDEKTVFTGTSSVPPVASESSSTDSSRDPSLTTGSIVFFDIESGNMIRKIGIVENGDVIACFWHVRLNQIIASCSTGDVKVLYNPQLSVNGACLSVKKAAKRSSSFDYQVSKGTDFKIYTPHALPLFRDEKPKSEKRKREKERENPIKSHRPELPISGQGEGGRSGVSSWTQVTVKNLVKDTLRTQDPREAILRHAKEAAENPRFTAMYLKTQPKPVFDTSEMDEEEEGEK